MAKLFIANCTKTLKELNYHVREQVKTFRQPIKIGHQVQIWKDASIEELQYIVDQLMKYGLRDAREAYKDKNFVGLCFSFDKPVKADLLEAMIEKNYKLLDDRAQEARVNSALVLNHRIQKEMQETGLPGGLRELSVTVKEEKRPGENIDKDPLHEQVKVSAQIKEGVRKERRVGN